MGISMRSNAVHSEEPKREHKPRGTKCYGRWRCIQLKKKRNSLKVCKRIG